MGEIQNVQSVSEDDPHLKSLGNDYDDCGEELSNQSSPLNKQDMIV